MSMTVACSHILAMPETLYDEDTANDVASWNGFDEQQADVMDGIGFILPFYRLSGQTG